MTETDVIFEIVADEHGLPVDMIRSRTRRHEFAAARHMAWVVINEMDPNKTLLQISSASGRNWHHTSIMYGMAKCRETAEHDAECALILRRCIERAIAKLGPPKKMLKLRVQQQRKPHSRRKSYLSEIVHIRMEASLVADIDSAAREAGMTRADYVRDKLLATT